MSFQRVSVNLTAIQFTEEVDCVAFTLWFLPKHGYYPSYDIAKKVAAGHGCDDSNIQEIVLIAPEGGDE